jgi:hypothetical protein
MPTIMKHESTKPLERYAGEAWIDTIEAALNTQTDLYINSLRWWRRMSNGLVAAQANGAGSAAEATSTAVAGVAGAAADGGEAAATRGESISRTLPDHARAHRKQAQTVGLDALTVNHLDRLASTNNVDDYPQSGAKQDKVNALAAAGLNLDALSIEHLDRLAVTNNLEDYPQSGNKSEKIAALEAAAVGPTSAN